MWVASTVGSGGGRLRMELTAVLMLMVMMTGGWVELPRGVHFGSVRKGGHQFIWRWLGGHQFTLMRG